MIKFPKSLSFASTRLAGVITAFGVLLASAVAPAAAQTGRTGQIHTQKVCPASTFTGGPGSYCTITVSDLLAIPPGTRIYYDIPTPQPQGTAGFIDTNILFYVGTGDWAVGRCTVDFSTLLGLCTATDGIGVLAGFSARLDVRIDFSTGITYWDGTYSFSPLPGRRD
jgi:hypothetical protein